MGNKKKKSQEIEIIGIKPPSLVADGHGVRLLNSGDADIVFFQEIDKKGNKVRAQIIAAVRISPPGIINLKNALNEIVESKSKTTKKKK